MSGQTQNTYGIYVTYVAENRLLKTKYDILLVINKLKKLFMGIFGIVYNTLACGHDILTDHHERIDEHVRRAKRSMATTLIDPVGVLDVTDVVDDVSE